MHVSPQHPGTRNQSITNLMDTSDFDQFFWNGPENRIDINDGMELNFLINF